MTNQCALIAGYMLHFKKNISDCENIYSLIDKSKSNNTSIHLIMVNRSYDSIENNDHGVYLAWNYYVFPTVDDFSSELNIVNRQELSNILTTMPEFIPQEFKNIVSKFKIDDNGFDVYVDNCDMDRRISIIY